jgi:hypothetical protein
MMSEIAQSPLTVLNETLGLLRRAEGQVKRLKEHADDLEIDPSVRSTQEKLQSEFVEQVYSIIDYWHNLPGKTILERIEGAMFSTLVIFDGESGDLPPFAVRPVDEDGNEGYDIAGYLHEVFCHKRRKGALGLKNKFARKDMSYDEN